MPFTFSHPAIVLPATYLPKKYYSLSGLIMGSMVPDFEYFIRMKDFSRYSHTWSGLFWFDVPLGILLLFLFHNLVRNTFIQHLPFSFNVRLSVFETFNWNQYFRKNRMVVILSLIVGAASHIFWDSFTHNGEYFARLIPFLRDKYDVLNYNVSGATLFQYIGSLIGGLIMMMYIFSFPEGRKTTQEGILHYWMLVGLVMLMVINTRLYLDYILDHHKHEDIIVTAISGLLAGIFSISVSFGERNQFQLLKKLDKIRNR